MIDIVPLLVLLLLAVLVVVTARRLHVPYTVALVVLGFFIGILSSAVGFSPLTKSEETLLAPGLFFNVLLPPIIFEAALHVNLTLLRRRAGLILSLAFAGVLFTTFFTGVLVSEFTSLSLIAALLLAAILSPTDPIAIVDLFRRLRVPEELSTIVESESLLNDAVGVLLFVVILQVLSTGSFSLAASAAQFVLLTVGGLAIGLVVAVAVYVLHRTIDEPSVETAISVVAAYGSFLLANAVGASGIIACAIAGIAVGSFVAPRAVAPESRQAIAVFWNVVVYIATSFIFLSIGLLFGLSHLLHYLGLIALVGVVMFFGRAAFVYAHRPLAGPGRRLPRSWYNVITFAGVRGAIPVVLALELLTSPPAGLSGSDVTAIVAGVLGVAFATILLGNFLADWYVKRAFSARPAD